VYATRGTNTTSLVKKSTLSAVVSGMENGDDADGGERATDCGARTSHNQSEKLENNNGQRCGAHMSCLSNRLQSSVLRPGWPQPVPAAREEATQRDKVYGPQWSCSSLSILRSDISSVRTFNVAQRPGLLPHT